MKTYKVEIGIKGVPNLLVIGFYSDVSVKEMIEIFERKITEARAIGVLARIENVLIRPDDVGFINVIEYKEKTIENPIKETSEDIIGKNFGKWTVTSLAERTGSRGAKYYVCKCLCGFEAEIAGNSLVCGKSKGCFYCRYKNKFKK